MRVYSLHLLGNLGNSLHMRYLSLHNRGLRRAHWMHMDSVGGIGIIFVVTLVRQYGRHLSARYKPFVFTWANGLRISPQSVPTYCASIKTLFEKTHHTFPWTDKRVSDVIEGMRRAHPKPVVRDAVTAGEVL